MKSRRSSKGTGQLRIGRRRVDVTSLDRVLFPDSGITKGDLIDYYRQIAAVMLPHVRDRPANLQRFPEGVGASGFFQQGMPDYFPDWVRSVVVAKEGGEVRHVLLQDAATLVYVANQGTITPHVWPSRADRLERPDRMIFDLDPPGDDPAAVRRAAEVIRELLSELELPAWLMTSGSRGYHVVVPLVRRANFDTVRAFAQDVAVLAAGRHPDELTTEVRKEKRAGRIFLDTLRNAYAHTSVPPYAVRARPGAPVAAPIAWDELDRTMEPRRFTLRTVVQRIERGGDPWADLAASAVSLGAARKRLDAMLAEADPARVPLPANSGAGADRAADDSRSRRGTGAKASPR